MNSGELSPVVINGSRRICGCADPAVTNKKTATSDPVKNPAFFIMILPPCSDAYAASSRFLIINTSPLVVGRGLKRNCCPTNDKILRPLQDEIRRQQPWKL